MKFHMSEIATFWIGLLFSNILLVWAVLPLFGNGYFPMHDDTQVARVIAMGNALKELQIPVRMVEDLGYGYGYPIFNFYSPLPYYVGGSLHAIGVDAVLSTKIMFLIPILLGASFLYLFIFPAYGIAASIVGSLLFSYAPYHAVQIYIRGSVGEYWAIAFVPLLLMSISNANKYRGYVWTAIGSFSIAAMLTSHTILSVLVITFYVLFSIAYVFYQLAIRTPRNFSLLVSLLLILLGGLGLSAFFWIPAFLEMKYTGVSTMIASAPTSFYDHFVCPFQLWNSPWAFGGSAPGCMSDGMSFKLGKIHVLFMLISLILYIWKRFTNAKNSTSFQFTIGILLLIISVFGMLEPSSFIWNVFPFTSLVQYPWRLLSISMMALGIVGAYGISLVPNSRIRFLTAFLSVVGIIAVNAKLFVPKYIYEPDLTHEFSTDDIRFRVSKISDEYLPDSLIKPKLSTEVPTAVLTTQTDARITIQSQKSTYVKATVMTPSNDILTFQKAAFPGWVFTIDGKSVQSDTIHGLPVFPLSKGTHQFEAVFKDTPIRAQSTIISVMTLLLLGGLLFYGQKNKA